MTLIHSLLTERYVQVQVCVCKIITTFAKQTTDDALEVVSNDKRMSYFVIYL